MFGSNTTVSDAKRHKSEGSATELDKATPTEPPFQFAQLLYTGSSSQEDVEEVILQKAKELSSKAHAHRHKKVSDVKKQESKRELQHTELEVKYPSFPSSAQKPAAASKIEKENLNLPSLAQKPSATPKIVTKKFEAIDIFAQKDLCAPYTSERVEEIAKPNLIGNSGYVSGYESDME